jgi:hypothetical protein
MRSNTVPLTGFPSGPVTVWETVVVVADSDTAAHTSKSNFFI